MENGILRALRENNPLQVNELRILVEGVTNTILANIK